jgi:hypothetical protein
MTSRSKLRIRREHDPRQSGAWWLRTCLPPSFVRLAGDLIEACVLCPTQPCPGRSTMSTARWQSVSSHKDVHMAVALDGFGAQLESHEVEPTAADRSLLSWALGLGSPVFAVEGAGATGRARPLPRLRGVLVWECERPRARSAVVARAT